MGSNDVPPPHVPWYYLPIANALLQIGGACWTLCYILLTLRSFRDRSYGMPLFALAYNFAWESIYGLLIAETALESAVFTIWLILDLGMVYGLLKYGQEEWNHAPLVRRNLGVIFAGLLGWCALAHWAFAKWWVDNNVAMKEGKFYRGIVGPDTTELVFWTALVSQTYLSVGSLGQLLIRQHTGGVSWGAWASRTLGSIIGLHLSYAWMWWHWREAHEYFMSPFAVVLWVTALISDLIYPFVFAQIRKSERLLPDGRKVAGDSISGNRKRTSIDKARWREKAI